MNLDEIYENSSQWTPGLNNFPPATSLTEILAVEANIIPIMVPNIQWARWCNSLIVALIAL